MKRYLNLLLVVVLVLVQSVGVFASGFSSGGSNSGGTSYVGGGGIYTVGMRVSVVRLKE